MPKTSYNHLDPQTIQTGGTITTLKRYMLLALFTLLCFTQPLGIICAESFKWTTQDGVTHFTDDISNVPVRYRSQQNDNADEETDLATYNAFVEKITIIEYGLYSANLSEGIEVANTNSGKISNASNIRLIEKTTAIAARLGTTFGLTYMVSGPPLDESVEITVKIISPPIHNPLRNKTSKVQSYSLHKQLNERTYDLYTFEQPWELVPGKWVMQILYKGKVMAAQTFIVKL